MYQSILVPLDGSEFSARALPAAAALARRTGATLNLVVVFDPSTMLNFGPGETSVPAFDATMINSRCDELRAWVEEQASSIANTGVAAKGQFLEGTVVEAIAEQVSVTRADIVVMTTHGRSGMDRLRIGSVASSFLGRSPVPVFLVRPAGADTPSPGHELPTGTLLVTLDGSKFGETILPHAIRFAEAAGLMLELMHVAEPVANPLSLFGADALVAEDFVSTDEEANARLYLEEQVKKIPESLQAGLTVISDNAPSRAIIQHAKTSDPGAIALATHGRSGFVRLLVGSVADKLLQGVEQPVLVYRPSGDASSGTATSAGAATT